MGVNLETARYLIAVRRADVSFRRTLTLGRQWLFAKPEKVDALLGRYGFPRVSCSTGFERGWADALFRSLGAEQLDVLDASNYEGASFIHDLNRPLENGVKRRYDFVFDGGTLEHVFDIASALRTCMQLTDVGGHLCICSVANNECGHGFYQFGFELFFRLFDVPNGFRLRSLLVEEQRYTGSRWLTVRDPADLGARVVCINRVPLHIKVLARKEREDAGLNPVVIQSDYQRAWSGHDSVPTSTGYGSLHSEPFRTRLLRYLPRALRDPLQYYYRLLLVTRLHNRRFFEPVDMENPPFLP